MSCISTYRDVTLVSCTDAKRDHAVSDGKLFVLFQVKVDDNVLYAAFDLRYKTLNLVDVVRI